MCALIYQMVWLREFRFVFGASTLASAAVLSVFFGGLGAGGFWFGRRVDRNPRPLALYAYLELLIAASAALTPLLVWIAREFYVALGGVCCAGAGRGHAGPARADRVCAGRSDLSHGRNTAGRSQSRRRRRGCWETPGRRPVRNQYARRCHWGLAGHFRAAGTPRADATLWAAGALNAVVGGCALWIARTYPAVFDKQVSVARAAASEVPRLGRLLIFATAAVVGLAFLLMELVWYRMLAPLLGGTTYTFGLILAVALLGIGLGGTAYALWGRKRPPALAELALTCILEALCIAIPFALGDQLAVLAGGLREWGAFGGPWVLADWSFRGLWWWASWCFPRLSLRDISSRSSLRCWAPGRAGSGSTWAGPMLGIHSVLFWAPCSAVLFCCRGFPPRARGNSW